MPREHKLEKLPARRIHHNMKIRSDELTSGAISGLRRVATQHEAEPEFCSTEVGVSNDKGQKSNNSQQQEFRLNCEPGEQRHFNYESATKVWGSSSQQVYLRATLRLSCMEPADNSTLKYLAQVLTVSGDFGDVISYKKSHQFRQGNGLDGKADLRVEPVLEEVGEAISDAADRVKRSVSGWFTKTWGSVKDFFVNIFSSSEKTSISREDAYRESGIDISSQCRSGGNKKPSAGLPIDDSVFDDLEPKYYIGASVDSLRGAAYDFDSSDEGTNLKDRAEEEEETISFFDDPKPTKSRSRRAAKQRESKSLDKEVGRRKNASPRALSSQYDLDHERLLRMPFVFIQSRTGRILEVRFSSEEIDLSVKNFKRHLCDLFATNLDQNKSQTNEMSPIGQHTTKYIVDPTLNSSFIKQSLMKSAPIAGVDPNKLLVKALATHQVGMTTPSSSGDYQSDWSKFGVESRDPGYQANGSAVNGSLGGGGGDSLSILRSINSTSNLQLNSKTIAPDIDQIQVRVKQVQQISEGRMVGSAGQLGMSLVQSVGGGEALRLDRVGRSVGAAQDGTRANKEMGELDDIADLLKVSTSFTVKLVAPSKLGDFSELTPSVKQPPGDQVNGRTAGDGVGRTKRSSSSTSTASSSSSSSKGSSDSLNMSIKKSDKDNNITKAALEQKSPSKAAYETTKGDGDKMGNSKPTLQQSISLKQPVVKRSREPLVVKAPEDQQLLQRTLAEWRQLELQLELKPSNLLPESSGQDGQVQRLEILRDQIQMRLNEEFMRNRLRSSRSHGRTRVSGDLNQQQQQQQQQQQVAAIRVEGAPLASPKEGATLLAQQSTSNGGFTSAKSAANDLGLGLTQLILDSGVTANRNGSVYGTIEEVLELEMALDEDGREGSVSRLMRDTIRADKLRAHCKSAIATLEEIRAPFVSHKVESKTPFGLLEEASEGSERLSRIVNGFQVRNRRKLDQCKQVVQLLLRLSDKQAADLVLELMDECNRRMLAGIKHEELGHGPTSRYYRSLRQQFIELMGNINRPSESLLDKLMARLHYSKLESADSSSAKRRPQTHVVVEPQQEFTYVQTNQEKPREAAGYNKSLLGEEDNYNNNDGAGSLVMTITQLAARPSIGRPKRVEIVEKLLLTLRGSSCSLFNGPDLDILESMGNFQEPLEEMVGKVVHLARRCRHQDQYLVACVHGLQGQLSHATTQRFLVDQLKSSNSSCTVKSEIVLTLIGAILIDELKLSSSTSSSSSPARSSTIQNNQIPSPGDNSRDSTHSGQWPLVGLNQVDDVLLELVKDTPKPQGSKQQLRNAQDRRCLKQLVAYYMSKKRPISNDIPTPKPMAVSDLRGSRSSNNNNNNNSKRTRRAVRNEDNFWDEAHCKRWALPDPASLGPDNNSSLYNNPADSSLQSDLLDEIDDNSILLALANHKPSSGRSGGSRSVRRNQKLIEREADLPVGAISSLGFINSTLGMTNGSVPIIRRRHKCTASKSFGPKNAEASLKAEIVNDLVGSRDENKFLARFRLTTNFLGNKIDVGRMYLWHQRHTTRAHVNILGKSLWDTSHGCEDKAPKHLLYMPLFDFNLWLVKISVGLRLQSEMGFFSNCDSRGFNNLSNSASSAFTSGGNSQKSRRMISDEPTGSGGNLELFPTMSVRASGEASAKFVVARAGMSLASQYGYQGSIRVSQQPESCMSVYSAHQPMNITFASWFQLWDSDCHYWGSRNKAEPQATKWKLLARKPSVWLEDECLIEPKSPSSSSATLAKGNSSSLLPSTITRSLQTISP